MALLQFWAVDEVADRAGQHRDGAALALADPAAARKDDPLALVGAG
jgi:hypothetical protein